jgi:hypothetical protein
MKRFLILSVLAAIGVAAIVDTADARYRRRRATTNNACCVRTVATAATPAPAMATLNSGPQAQRYRTGSFIPQAGMVATPMRIVPDTRTYGTDRGPGSGYAGYDFDGPNVAPGPAGSRGRRMAFGAGANPDFGAAPGGVGAGFGAGMGPAGSKVDAGTGTVGRP